MEELVVTKDNNTEEEPLPPIADQEREASPPHVSVVIQTPEGRVLHKVPPHMRENRKHIYDPVVLSIGPYHDHGLAKFREVEQLKEVVLGKMLEYSKVKGSFLDEILKRVDEIRNFYKGLSRDEYNDDELAKMMLLDGAFVVNLIGMIPNGIYLSYKDFVRRLGLSGVIFMFRDFYMLENQIPFWVIKLLLSLTLNNKDNEELLLCNFLSRMCFGDQRMTRVPWEQEEKEPLHLLQAYHATIVKKDTIEPVKPRRCQIFKFRWGWSKRSPSSFFENWRSPYRSVTELKAKGIHFRPSSYCLQDIRFDSYSLYGKLHLPIRYVNNNSKVFFSNIIAFEMSPETETDFAVTSYVNFMKTLIESPKDVRELREKGILLSYLPNDEEVVQMFKEIDTYGANYSETVVDVKTKIKEHCHSKGKTWMAELADTYFHSPWNAIALLAATYILFLATLQTYYTVFPK